MAAPEATPLEPCDVPLALGALLLRAAAEAQEQTPLIGVALVDAVLARRHELTPREAAEMRLSCQAVAAAAPDTACFAAMLARAVAYRDRLALAHCLCEVMAGSDPAPSDLQAAIWLSEHLLFVAPCDLSQSRAI
ncbi:TerB family tellurite resistance protein [Salipiger mangrovisoli]|uniref:TerB family tellurite resistance protein n=1 Tax=Salipiger mangrovisoli TaxID=2865933 RepID=A0ABR9WZ07_9RHOB|nr:TerB family tellurite resistance protein [Salipiger mangrovisoli]MBE9636522.1 TerB family tellurite resistance protein [Salipiger mangrovisoli]